MDLLKNLVVFALLAAAAAGVYILITNNPQPKPPPEVGDNWSRPSSGLNIDVPNVPTMSATMPNGAPALGDSTTPGSALPSEDAPAFNSGNSTAPRFQPTPPPAAIQSGGEAPRFSPPANQYPNVATSHIEPVDRSPAITLPSDAARPAPNAEPPAGPGAREIRGEFAAFIDAAKRKLEEGGLVEAHERLSLFYANPRLTPEEDHQLTELLDQVAGTVIYSRQHLLEPPYVVQPGETLPQIAGKYDVPWQLLAKINGLADPRQLQPGQELKVVRGPFNAVIHLDRFELALLLHSRYAGRFRIGIGRDSQLLEGSYLVRDKVVNPTYYGNGRQIDADDPNNPLGERLIGLGSQMSIHGTNDPQAIGRSGGPGCLCLGSRDVEDVFDILSVGSRVVIQR